MLHTLAHRAAEMGHVNVIETLIDYGADVKLADCNGRSAMHHAARACQVEAMEALLEGLSPQEVCGSVEVVYKWRCWRACRHRMCVEVWRCQHVEGNRH